MNEKLLSDYKYLHQIPEESFKEYKTHKYILEQLQNLDCVIHELNPTGILAYFDYKKNETIAFRCEMDGLPINEENDIDYNSKHSGFMHACGHDGHMAMMLSLAYQLNKIKCQKNICLIFQPSEECYGGANKIINSLDFKKLNIKEIYGMHLWPGIKSSHIASRAKLLMASATEIDITIIGKAVHIANKDSGVDSIKLSLELLNSLQDIEGVVFNCGKITSTGARNIVCDKVTLECSLRSFYKIKRKVFLNMLNTTAKDISNKNGGEILIHSKNYIPEVKNNLCLFEKFRHLIDEVVSPVYQAEDFSFYSNDIKSLFLFLGVGDSYPLHSNKFIFDPSVLEKGLKILYTIATTY